MTISPEQAARNAAEADPSPLYSDGRPKMHRHTFQHAVHFDDECVLGLLPDGQWATSRRRVYVFDGDVLPEHERIIAERAWQQGHDSACQDYVGTCEQIHPNPFARAEDTPSVTPNG